MKILTILKPNHNDYELYNKNVSNQFIIDYNKIYSKLLNNDVNKYPPNSDIMNYYILNMLLTNIRDNNSFLFLPKRNNSNIIHNSLLTIMKTHLKYNYEIISFNKIFDSQTIIKRYIIDRKKVWCIFENNELANVIGKNDDLEEFMSSQLIIKCGFNNLYINGEATTGPIYYLASKVD